MSTELRFHRAATVLLTAALLATLTVALTGGQRADAIDGPVEVVYVATGQNFPDALAGANLAATVGAPMLTVNPDLPIPDATTTALQALDPNQIIILGGPVAVSDAVADALADHARSGAVTRIEGGDRHDTAARIADALPDKVHDADLLDGLDSSDFLRAGDLGRMSAILGTRDRTLEAQTTSGLVVAKSFDFTAPAAGFAFIATTVAVRNRVEGPQSVRNVLALDWNGDPSTPNLLGVTIGVTDLDLAGTTSVDGGEAATAVITTAIPVAAGDHTLDLLLSTTNDYAYSLANISVVFSPTGTTSPVGILGEP